MVLLPPTEYRYNSSGVHTPLVVDSGMSAPVASAAGLGISCTRRGASSVRYCRHRRVWPQPGMADRRRRHRRREHHCRRILRRSGKPRWAALRRRRRFMTGARRPAMQPQRPRRYWHAARQLGAHRNRRAVATSAVRDAANADEFPGASARAASHFASSICAQIARLSY